MHQIHQYKKMIYKKLQNYKFKIMKIYYKVKFYYNRLIESRRKRIYKFNDSIIEKLIDRIKIIRWPKLSLK